MFCVLALNLLGCTIRNKRIHLYIYLYVLQYFILKLILIIDLMDLFYLRTNKL